jgi:hypothetical protein
MAKAFSWSYSKLNSYEKCPKRHYEVDLAKNYADQQGEALLYGNKVHQVLAAHLGQGTPLPPEMLAYQTWADKVRNGTGQLLVEQKYAINRAFGKTSWFAPDAWFRGIGDVVRLNAPAALVLDWKTGKILEDSVQLALMAQIIFSHYPEIMIVRSEFVWLKEDCQTSEMYTRDDMVALWPALLERVDSMEQSSISLNYPPNPGCNLCRNWCPVTSCVYHKKGL